MYLLDANVFIEAHRRYYGFDFCPAFWEWLIIQNEDEKQVFSIEKVWDEIKNYDDRLAEWAKKRGSDFFIKPVSEMPDNLEKVAAWVRSQPYTQSAVVEFLDTADYYLIAHALSRNNDAVVTHEVSSDAKNKIKIPDVCTGLDIKCLGPFEMLRKEGARFVLDNSSKTFRLRSS